MSNDRLASLLSFPREQLDALNDDDFAAWQRLVELDMALVSPAAFATTYSHGLWKPYRHLVRTSDEIVGMLEQDTCDCLVIEQPVRHGKTELCSRWTPAWFVIKHRLRVLLASYSDDFAAGHGRRAREIVAEVGPAYGVHLDQASKAAFRWEITDGDAGMNTAGAGGSIIGRGGSLLVVDDPQKQDDVIHQLSRDRIWEWWQGTFLTRREPGGKVLVIMSRWHNDDLVARLLEGDFGMRVRTVRFPALAEEGDPLGREPGEALCPERFDRVDLENRRVDVGPHVWAAQYQQRPMADGGGMFRRPTFRYWRKARDVWLLEQGDETKAIDPAECFVFATMDPAFTRSKRSDYTVAAVWAVAPTDPPSLVLLDRLRIRVEAAEHADVVTRLYDQWKPAWFGIERQNATLTLFGDVQRRGVVVRELRPDRNKVARAEVAVALTEAGRVYFPRHAPWLDEWESELTEFPVSRNDDQVDVFAYAATELARHTVRPPRHHRFDKNTPEERAARMIERRAHRPNVHPVLGRMH